MTFKTQCGYPVVVGFDASALPVSQLVAMRRNYCSVLATTALAWGIPYSFKESFVAVHGAPKHQSPPR